jgi:glycosyltransferase involved in cell wall biosynthesis
MIDRRNILLVSNGFYPEISPRSFRATELAKEFFRRGHKVTVISKHRDHDYSDFLHEFPITFKMWGKTGFPIIPDFKKRPFSFLCRTISRLLLLLFEYPGIEEMFQVKKMLKHERGYDLMISFAVPYPVHWGVAWERSEKRHIAKTWVADCGDPYMFARLDTFKKPFYFKFLEVNFCKRCNYISIPFKEMQVQFYPQFISKIKVIPQGVDFKEIKLYEGQINNEKPVFIFAGSIIPRKRDLTLLLDFLASLSVDFLFIVYTNQTEWFDKYRIALGEKLEIRRYIERLSLFYEMSKADFLVNVDTIHDNHSNTEAVPSKLIDYALSNRPIMNISSAYLDKEMVIEFLNKDYSRQRVVEKSNYDISKVSAKFLELLN